MKRINIIFAKANAKENLEKQIDSLIEYGEDNKLPNFFLYRELVGVDNSNIIEDIIFQAEKNRLDTIFITQNTIFHNDNHSAQELFNILHDYNIKIVNIDD